MSWRIAQNRLSTLIRILKINYEWLTLIKTMSLAKLNELELNLVKAKYPNNPYPVATVHKDKTAGALSTAVSRWIELNGGFSTRMSVEGRVIMDGMGNAKRIPSSNLKGSADTTGCFLSVRLEVEIKIGADTMKEHQIKFRDRIRSADGFYMTVKTFDDFHKQWIEFIKYLPEHFLNMHKKSLEFIDREGLQ